ncbi:MAG TPA: SDR family oxidoreductase [Actinomycetota bacterium]|nr:SDR family oxidoreductase [Actinomycetota bacterium]
MPPIVITGSASGIGAATAARLRSEGHEIIGVDLRDAEVIADLATPDGRRSAIESVLSQTGESIAGLVTCAGIAGKPDRPGSLVAQVNYFGTVELLAGLREALAAGGGAAVAISSNSATVQPGVPMDVVEVLLSGDLDAASAAADATPGGSIAVYPASKIAVAWWVRRNAPKKAWIGSGVRLNAIAPGIIDTAFTQELRADPLIGPAIELFPVPMGRSGRPEEIAAVVAFLLGPDASLFSGSVLFADGGTDAKIRADDWPAPWVVDDPAAAWFGDPERQDD